MKSKKDDKKINEEIKSESINYSRECFGVEKWISLDKLNIDLRTQRNLMEGQVKKIVKEFSPSAFGRIIISMNPDENGKHHIQDGQHRVAALKLLGYEEAPCIMVDA